MRVIASASESEVKQAGAIQLKNCVNKYWGFNESNEQKIKSVLFLYFVLLSFT